nr:hypothetical protein GCM10020093_111990 [Planobispora longispora]
MLSRPDAHAVLVEAARELLAEADRYGYGPEEVIHIIREIS